ncbi:hypothetical protein WJX74_009489 [Apatococcus lobatus]|uniref:Uncharacterized protein n=1 Tax=Apatococcus lobatus TaxID=904363 RepID=A0AAW1RW59_9CHLO
MWTASLDHLFSRENGQWSLHSRLDPVIEVWHKSLDLRPLFRQSRKQLDGSTASTLEICPEQLQDASYSCSAASPQPILVDFGAAPLYLKRPYIDKFYLIGGNERTALLHTLFTWTNETLNAWTMMLGLVVALSMQTWSRQNIPSEQMPFLIYAVSSMLHLPFSVKLHCSIGVSQKTREKWRALDVLFILLCSVPRGAALAWYVFTSPGSYWTYVALISAIDAAHIHSMYIRRNIHDVNRFEVSRRVGIMMLCFTAPLVTACLYELVYIGIGPCIMLTVAIISCLVIGGLAYVHRAPERWLPGKLDLFGNSHQLMHVFIVLGYLLEGLFIAHMAMIKISMDHPSCMLKQQESRSAETVQLLSHLVQHYGSGWHC